MHISVGKIFCRVFGKSIDCHRASLAGPVLVDAGRDVDDLPVEEGEVFADLLLLRRQRRRRRPRVGRVGAHVDLGQNMHNFLVSIKEGL